MMRQFSDLSLVLCLLLCWCFVLTSSAGAEKTSDHMWKQIVVEAERLGLPVKFLKAVPSGFVTFEFDDLQAFAAEYHLGEHRMVLNRTLSFNTAGGTLRPLNRLTNTEMETLYHELFHAYMDFLATDGGADALTFARKVQQCRYGAVLINPVVQRRAETEERFLNDVESWEALNEAWAVFVGWAVWSQLESGGRASLSLQKSGKSRAAWLHRLEDADREGKLRGYYEPENPEERAVARKRFLAPASRISPEEVHHLMKEALGFPDDLVKRADQILSSGSLPRHSRSC
jgi:hypothetical protein